MNIKEYPIKDLIPYENNPRNNKEAVEYVANSIKEFGFKVPIVIDKDMVIVAGHTRLLAAEKLGLESVPCIVADDLTPDQVKAFRLADNKTGEFASWDFEKLEFELDELSDFDMEQFGFTFEDEDDFIPVDEDEFGNIERMEKHYGVPYQGNKSRIADILISILPPGERLVDLFGGGVR